MDYKDKYEKAVQAAMLAKQDTESAVTIGILEEIFPELRESEDERIRKELIKETKGCEVRLFETVTNDEFIAWLEKHGKKTKPIEGFNTEFERQMSCLIASAMNRDYEYTKDFVKWTSDALLNYAKLEIEKNSMGISEATKKKLVDNLNKALEKETAESLDEFLEKQGEPNTVVVIPKFRVGDVIRSKGSMTEYTIESISGECYHGKGWGLHISCDDDYELVKQNNAWSEEDIVAIDCAVEVLNKDLPSLAASIDRLKSLRDRYTWKPSDEQMDALYTYIYNPQYFNSQDPRMELVESVYQDLKKLREE